MRFSRKMPVIDLVITADLLVEDIDFRLAWTTPELLGQKALAVSLSDIAAMGAIPNWATVSMGIPKRLWMAGFAEKFYEGWLRLARHASVELVGGDVSRTPERFVVDSIVAGEVSRGKAILRSGAETRRLDIRHRKFSAGPPRVSPCSRPERVILVPEESGGS